MSRFVHLLRKDFRLLVRDVWGVVLLFLMPWTLVLMMTYLQDSTFRSISEHRVPLYLLNGDGDSLGNLICRQIMESGIFEASTGKLSETALEEAVSRGDYLIGVIIPEGATQRLRQNVAGRIARAFNGGDALLPNGDALLPGGDALLPGGDALLPNGDALADGGGALEIKLLIDPRARQSFRTTLIQAVRENALMVQHELLLAEIAAQVNRIVPIPVDIDVKPHELITINESYARSDRTKIIPNSPPHNVPAWSMFAVFFIVISLAGNMIRERETGCFDRLMTTPCTFPLYIAAKVSVYLCVCMLQLAMMILTGMYLIPLLDLPALQLGQSAAALFAVSVSVSLAAIGYGLATGSVARTNQQASIFGAVSVVILAAIGGVWIPTFIMPRFMQTVSHLSPLSWGLNGFHDLFVRDAGFSDLWPYISASLLFFLTACAVALRCNRKRRK